MPGGIVLYLSKKILYKISKNVQSQFELFFNNYFEIVEKLCYSVYI